MRTHLLFASKQAKKKKSKSRVGFLIDDTKVKRQEKWETPDKLAQLTKAVTLRVALVESTHPNATIRYPKADGAHRRHDYAPIDLTCSSDYAHLEKAVQVVIDDTLGYEKCPVYFSYIYYDPTYVSLLPNYDGTICDMKNNESPLAAITSTPEFKKGLDYIRVDCKSWCKCGYH